jgi:hypothetical protein
MMQNFDFGYILIYLKNAIVAIIAYALYTTLHCTKIERASSYYGGRRDARAIEKTRPIRAHFSQPVAHDGDHCWLSRTHQMLVVSQVH